MSFIAGDNNNLFSRVMTQFLPLCINTAHMLFSEIKQIQKPEVGKKPN